MTTADPQPARPGRFRDAWHGFGRWRRTRPFWGGLLTALGGLEIFGTTQMALGGLSFQMGPTGFLSWLVPTILVACGLLMWFSPQQRIFYAVVAAVTALFSLIGVNLGGFFIGLSLGMIGSALGFAWMPDPRPAEPTTPPVSGQRTADPDPADPTDLADPAEAAGPAGTTDPGGVEPTGPTGTGRDPRLYAVLPALLGLAAAVALAVPNPTPVQAAPTPALACPTRPATPGATPTGPTRAPAAGPGASPSGGPARSPSAGASASPSSGPEAGRDVGGNLLTDILNGIGDLFGVGRDDVDEATTAAPTATPRATPASPTPRPGATSKPGRRPAAPVACPTDTPKPSRPGPVENGRPLPRIAVSPGQPVVAEIPSKLTGSKVTMTGLRFEGIVDLPTTGGTLKALKFGMDRAVTDDFLLRSPGPAGRTMRFATDRLTVKGDVAFYATRFVGRLLGIKITLTPNLPFPDGIPITSPIPITFTDPAIDLAFVESDTLTARPALKLTLD